MQKKLQRLPGNSLPIRLKNLVGKLGVVVVFTVILGSRHVLREMAHEMFSWCN